MAKSSIEAGGKHREYQDFFDLKLEEVDPDISQLIGLEEEKQARKLMMIASESICPRPVLEALSSVFTNLYAEGYPSLRMRREHAELLMDLDHQMVSHRRYADRRYYKGCGYVNLMETLAQRRVAELFATDRNPAAKIRIRANEIYANVQPLSGAIANNAIYDAFLKPGDTVMGMALNSGGHLTHGSEANRSGKYYNVVSYSADLETGKLDYGKLKEMAAEHKPKMIIAGYSAYPWSVDWEKFREVADAADGAILLADIAHTAGLVVAGQHPNPIGWADAVMFTTQKTICGPRGAVILTTDREKAELIDSAVFPGEQSGPHLPNIAAKAVCFEIAKTPEFRELQRRIVENAQHLGRYLKDLGLEIAYGGTNSHMLLVNLRPIESKTSYPLSGEIASRILELCGIVVNKNTIPGDDNALHPSAIRFGTTWVTQRGMGKGEMKRIAELVYEVLSNIYPFEYIGRVKNVGRGKINFGIIEEVRSEVSELESKARRERAVHEHRYPHFPSSMMEERGESPLLSVHAEMKAVLEDRNGWLMPRRYGTLDEEKRALKEGVGMVDNSDAGIIEIVGRRALSFLEEACTREIVDMDIGETRRAFFLDESGQIIDDVLLAYTSADRYGRHTFIVVTNPQNAGKLKLWLRSLSDAYVLFDTDDIFAKVQGPVIIRDLKATSGNPKTVIALCGPFSYSVLKQFTTDWDGSRMTTFSIDGATVQVLPSPRSKDGSEFTIILPREKAAFLWKKLLQEGVSFGLKPVGFEAAESIREESDFPVYGRKKRPTGVDYVSRQPELFTLSKLYFVGQKHLPEKSPETEKREFVYREAESLKRSCLYEEHLKLTSETSMKPFAGWIMPILYTSIADEHRAVRETAGLFDVSHMGVLEVSGNHASSFLDAVTTNYASWLIPGESQYSYVLDPDGNVLDDVFIYCLTPKRFMIITNAVNTEKIKSWLLAVSSKEFLIDREHPAKEVPFTVRVRDLKEASCGKDQRVDIALQGPNSRKILRTLCGDNETARRLWNLEKSHFIQTELNGLELIVSRSGYTGEEYGYEFYVHPVDAPKLWRLLLEKGEKFGIKPAGLGARDSTRTEAGLPLWGNELAGKYDIFPTEAGYGSFVKLHKAFFVGRKRALEIVEHPAREMIRFRMERKGIPVVRHGDHVLNNKEEPVGKVTSCVVVEGQQVGMAIVSKGKAKVGSDVIILLRSYDIELPEEEGKLRERLKTLRMERAEVLPRFMAEVKDITLE